MTVDELPTDVTRLNGRPQYDGRSDTVFLYFLTRGGVVVYIGASGDLAPRVNSHRKGDRATAPKDFDAVYYKLVELNAVAQLEAAYIANARPEYNIEGVTKNYKFCHRRRPYQAVVIPVPK